MTIKWSILLPALVLISLSGYYIATQPEGTTISATGITPVAVSTTVEVQVDEPELQIETQPEPIQPTQEVEEEVPADETPIPEAPEPDVQEEEKPPLEEESALVEEEPAPEPEEPDPQLDEPDTQEEEPTPQETASAPQPLDSDIYSLSGSYLSDQGVTVDIQFTDGFYRISLQGMSDSHHTITELSPPSGNTLDLSITLTNLPFTVTLSRSEDGTLSIAAYMAGSTAPMLSATATKAE